MQTQITPFTASKRPVFYTFLSFSLLCLLTMTWFPAPTTYAAAVPGGNISSPVVRAVDQAKPSIVRIITTLGGRLTVYFTNTGSNQTVTFPLNGGQYDLALSGTGSFISSHGDILTADHVINPPKDKSMDDFLEQEASQDVADYVNQHLNPQVPVSSDDMYSYLASGYFPSQSSYTTPSSEVYLSTDYAGPLDSVTSLQNLPANMHAKVDKIEKVSPFDQNDVAIIHVSMDNTPSIQLGDSSAVAQQDTLTIIGYPGNGDLNTDPTNPDPGTFLVSSVNQIYVSAIKQNTTGAELIQVGGNVEHGDSGGPALDNQGHIVGTVSFSEESDPLGDTSFLQTSNSAKTLINQLNLDVEPGKFERSWQAAFTAYTSQTAGHWHTANADFAALAKNYPDFKAVMPFVNYTAQEAQHEIVPTTDATNPGAIQTLLMTLLSVTLLIAIAACVIAGIVIWLIIKKRKRNRPAYPVMPMNPMQMAQAPAVPFAMTHNVGLNGEPLPPTALASMAGSAVAPSYPPVAPQTPPPLFPPTVPPLMYPPTVPQEPVAVTPLPAPQAPPLFQSTMTPATYPPRAPEPPIRVGATGASQASSPSLEAIHTPEIRSQSRPADEEIADLSANPLNENDTEKRRAIQKMQHSTRDDEFPDEQTIRDGSSY